MKLRCFRPISAIILLLLAPLTRAADVPVWGLFEATLTNSRSYSNPFTDVELNATFTGPDGTEVEFFGFHDGDGKGNQLGSIWKLRFTPDQQGLWTYVYTWSDGTPGESGSFTAVASDLPGPIYPDKQNPRVWSTRERGEFIPISISGVGYSEADDPRLDDYLDFVKGSLGANGVALVLVNRVWLDCEENVSCSPSSAVFSIRNWTKIDQLMRELRSRELGANIMVYTDDEGRPLFAGGSTMEQSLFRYMIARLAPYPQITFDSGIDIREYRSATWSNWFAQTLNGLDPWNHPVSSRHGGGSGDFSCNACNYDSRGDVHPTYSDILSLLTASQQPVFYTDRWREDFRRGNFDSDSLRKTMWSCAVAGGAGFIVGGRNGGLRLDDFESDLDNPAQLKAFSDFWHERVTTWRGFSVCNDQVSNGSCFADAASRRWVVYLENGGSTTVDISSAAGRLSVERLNPRTGELFLDAPVMGGGQVELAAPDSGDWVVYIGGRLTDETPPTVPENLHATPVSDGAIELKWMDASDLDSSISGYRIYGDGTLITTVPGSQSSFLHSGLEELTEYGYTLSAVNGGGTEGPRSDPPIVATTLADTSPPVIVSVTGVGNPNLLSIVFSEAVTKATAEDSSNYTITPTVKVLSATLEESSKTVTLGTTALAPDRTYTLTVTGVSDRSSIGNPMPPNTKMQFSFFERVAEGLVVLYTFEEESGTVVRDVSGTDPPLDLQIADKDAATWVAGGLAITGDTIVRSPGPCTKIIEACKATGELTIEAWLRPASDSQSGPSRIITLSLSPSERNFTFGQDARNYDVRFRTTKTDDQGLPSLTTSTNPVVTNLSHLIYTRDTAGAVKIFVDGSESASDVRAGDLSNWSSAHPFALANEMTLDRTWLGVLYLVAIYNRALSPSDARLNFNAGPETTSADTDHEGDATSVGPFIRGDCDGNGVVGGSPTEAVIGLSHTFRGGAAPPCLAACDAEANGSLGITDYVRILRFSFASGEPPDAPFPDCVTSNQEGDLALGCQTPFCPP